MAENESDGIAVVSSWIRCIAYDVDAQVLTVHLHSGLDYDI